MTLSSRFREDTNFFLHSPSNYTLINHYITFILFYHRKSMMEKDVLKSLAEHFDHYVMEQISQNSPAVHTPKHQSRMECYRAEMEKRLRLRPPTHQEKFATLFKPMTGLKSYVSVEDFLRKLNSDVMSMGRTPLEPQKADKVAMSEKDKLIRKTEAHLWKNRSKRRLGWGEARKMT